MADSCDTCQMEGRIKALESGMEQNRSEIEKNRERASETHKEFFDRLRLLEKDGAVRDQQYGTILEKLDAMNASITKVTKTVTDIQAEPGKDWKDFKSKASWAVAGAIIAAVMAFLLRQVGL